MYSSTFGKGWVGRSCLCLLVWVSFGSFSLRELTCMHCVSLALWTHKVLCGSLLCALYKFSFIQGLLGTGRRGGGRGYGSGGRGRVYTYRYTVTTSMIPALRWAAMRAIVSVGSDGQSHRTVSTNHNLFEEIGEPKRYRTEVLPLTNLTPYR